MHNEANNFSIWIKTSKPLTRYVYHIGFSPTDSILSKEMGATAWKRACMGDIYLVQRKIQPYKYEFIAIKASSPPIRKLIPLVDALTEKHFRKLVTKNANPVEHLEYTQHG